MPHLDRLSNLISKFEIRAQLRNRKDQNNLVISGANGSAEQLCLYLREPPKSSIQQNIVASLNLDLGGMDNPLLKALPGIIKIKLNDGTDVKAISDLIVKEASAPRCGGGFVLDRLCELLVVHLLRHRIEQGVSEPGLLAGLAHPKLSRVIVAMHERPDRQWQVDDFLQIAGMSRSQFMAEFQSVIGQTPIAYLKHWRMILARIAVLKGQRIKEVARNYGYGSGDALCRAFVSEYGISPTGMFAQAQNQGL